MLTAAVLHTLAESAGLELAETIRFDAKAACYAAIPNGVHDHVKQLVHADFPKGLYAHQAKAIALGIQGVSVCLATPTASGKTLTFTSIALSQLLFQPGSTVLALYPAKALLHDQYLKWQAAMAGSGLTLAIIDGGVAVADRVPLLKSAQVVLMTPDVLHAWLMSNLAIPEIQQFLATLSLVVLDEAHCYDGVSGTNMAYLLRRLQAVSGVKQFLASSATIGDAQGFLQLLTGVAFSVIGAHDDGAAAPEKQLMLCRMSMRHTSKFLSALLQVYHNGEQGRFLIFADSRKRVEELVAESHRLAGGCEAADASEQAVEAKRATIMPYRAGYEEGDREHIQQGLTQGTLAGVITTSALELGIDIGDIELVVMLGTPPSIKSFWQRAGRAGRRTQGCILLLDLDGRVSDMGLTTYLQRQPEPNWLYLENEYLQYANALCAAEEQQQFPATLYSSESFASLPSSFLALLANELEPTQAIPNELYPLKQQAINGAHRAFPLRNSIEKSYQVTCKNLPNVRLGSLSYSQALREAFPGAIYRYMAKPYRIYQLKHSSSEACCAPIRSGAVTKPLVQTKIFPRFEDRVYAIRQSTQAFIAECSVQVSERVIGFIEQFGQTKNEIRYQPGNQYAQKPLNRWLDTTGVCFYFPDAALQAESLAKYIALAFCKNSAVQERDIGFGTFISQKSPLGHGQVKGIAIFDSVYGSLRLTRQILPNLAEILQAAERMALEEGATHIARSLADMCVQSEALASLQEHRVVTDILMPADSEWLEVIAANQVARCHDGQSHINEEVTVLGYLYTPQGIRYRLNAEKAGLTWQVCAAMVQPIHGCTVMEYYNINTGETRQVA